MRQYYIPFIISNFLSPKSTLVVKIKDGSPGRSQMFIPGSRVAAIFKWVGTVSVTACDEEEVKKANPKTVQESNWRMRNARYFINRRVYAKANSNGVREICRCFSNWMYICLVLLLFNRRIGWWVSTRTTSRFTVLSSFISFPWISLPSSIHLGCSRCCDLAKIRFGSYGARHTLDARHLQSFADTCEPASD